MLFISVEDFLEQARQEKPLTREAERALAQKRAAGDREAGETLIRSYLPHAAAAVKHAREEYRTLELALRCVAVLEKAAEGFDFLQDSETFSHRLSWHLRQTVVRYIADRPTATSITDV